MFITFIGVPLLLSSFPVYYFFNKIVFSIKYFKSFIKWSLKKGEKVKVLVTQSCPTLCKQTLWSVVCQAPLSMEFSRQKYGVGSHSLLQRIFPTQRLNLVSHIASILFTIWAARKVPKYFKSFIKCSNKQTLTFCRFYKIKLLQTWISSKSHTKLILDSIHSKLVSAKGHDSLFIYAFWDAP